VSDTDCEVMQWWPKGRPIPKGWEETETHDHHHDHHSVLLKQKLADVRSCAVAHTPGGGIEIVDNEGYRIPLSRKRALQLAADLLDRALKDGAE